MWIIYTFAMSCFLSLVFYSCSSSKDLVMPGTDGINLITLRNEIEAQSQAVTAANRYCADAKQKVVFLKNNLKKAD